MVNAYTRIKQAILKMGQPGDNAYTQKFIHSCSSIYEMSAAFQREQGRQQKLDPVKGAQHNREIAIDRIRRLTDSIRVSSLQDVDLIVTKWRIYNATGLPPAMAESQMTPVDKKKLATSKLTRVSRSKRDIVTELLQGDDYSEEAIQMCLLATRAPRAQSDTVATVKGIDVMFYNNCNASVRSINMLVASGGDRNTNLATMLLKACADAWHDVHRRANITVATITAHASPAPRLGPTLTISTQVTLANPDVYVPNTRFQEARRDRSKRSRQL